MPKYNNPRKTWRYAGDFKIRAVEMIYHKWVQIQQVLEGLGIHPFMLSRWRKEYREGIRVGEKRVERIRRDAGLVGRAATLADRSHKITRSSTCLS